MERGRYTKYPREDLVKAIDAVQRGRSVAGASKDYGIPRKTLADHVSGRSTLDRTAGRPTCIPIDVENAICEKVVKASLAGFPITKKQLLVKIGAVAKNLGLKTPFKDGVTGKDFWYGLKRRHLELSIRKPESCASNRLTMMTKQVIDRYFDDLEALLDQRELMNKPHQVWNCDETGLQFCPESPKVVAKKGERHLVARCSPSKESITTMACISAAGGVMPPLYIAKGKTKKFLYGFATLDAPTDTFWTFQENGWMNDAIGIQWFKEVFLANCGTARPQVIILDSHHSHEVLDLLELANKQDIHILALPPHTTHMLQPLDRVMFKPFKTNYREKCAEFLTSNPGSVINKATWPRLLNDTWIATMTPELARKSFEATGIFPLNRERIPESAFVPGKTLAAFKATTPPPLDTVSASTSPSTSISTSSSTSPTPSTSASNSTSSSTSTACVADIEAMSDISFLNNLVIDIDGEETNIGAVVDSIPTANWHAEVEEQFGMKTTPPSSAKKSPKRAITTHRLLTSEEIMTGKREDKQRKERQEAEKKERKEKMAKRKLERKEAKAKKTKK